VSITGDRGFFTRTVFARKGLKFRVWSLLDDTYSPPLAIR
jgi:hypothetical protein